MIAGVILAIVLVSYALGYTLYGRAILERRVVRASEERETPAWKRFDGIDYVPTNKWVLYGHHFASIAGAGPIVGPAIAMAYGWLLPLAWVILGNIFIGAVHDYLALMASVRHGGVSIMSVSETVMGRKARYIFLIYVYSALILVLAAFLSVAALLFSKMPETATKAMIYMPAAVLIGMLMYRAGVSARRVAPLAVALLIAAILYSIRTPLLIPGDAYHTWMLLLAAYMFIASVLPVWYLLQPRDYLNAYILWGFIATAIVASIVAFSLPLTAPAYTEWAPPIIAKQPTPFWPAIPLIIACGSLSGFHSIVASGTTSKQLASEMDALLVGYGGMLTEGAVSSLAVILPIAIAWNTQDMIVLLEAAGASPTVIAAYRQGGILALDKVMRFTYSYGYMVGKAFGSLEVIGASMAKFAGIALATFILTTLDTATRLARFTWQEMFDWLASRSPRAHRVLANMFVGSGVATLLGLILAYPNVQVGAKSVPAYQVLWPAFAGTNQLLAALALMTSALWVYAVLGVRKARYNLLIQVPAIFLWVTVTVGLAWWMIAVMPRLPMLQKIGAGTLVAISLGMNFLLLVLYVKGLIQAKTRGITTTLGAEAREA